MIARLLGGPLCGRVLARPTILHSVSIPTIHKTAAVPLTESEWPPIETHEYRVHRELGRPFFEYWGTK